MQAHELPFDAPNDRSVQTSMSAIEHPLEAQEQTDRVSEANATKPGMAPEECCVCARISTRSASTGSLSPPLLRKQSANAHSRTMVRGRSGAPWLAAKTVVSRFELTELVPGKRVRSTAFMNRFAISPSASRMNA